MAIYEKIPKKKYLVRVPYRDAFGKAKELRKIVNGTKTDAKLVESELIREKQNISDDSITFGELFKLYLDSKINVVPDTKRKYTEQFNKSLKPLENIKMDKIKPIHFMEVRNQIEATDSTWTQKNHTIYLMKSISKFGYEYLNFRDNSRMIKAIPKSRSTKPKYYTLSIQEFEEIMNYVDNYVYFALYNLLYWSGLRKGEARALFKSDLYNGGIDVSKTLADSSDEVQPPKTASSNRFIPLDNKTLETLKPLVKQKGKWLFGDIKPLPSTNIARHLKNAIDKANVIRARKGIEELPHIRIHDLRHSHATLLIENKESIKAISERLGHSSTNETQKTYIHLYKDADKRVAENINKLREE